MPAREPAASPGAGAAPAGYSILAAGPARIAVHEGFRRASGAAHGFSIAAGGPPAPSLDEALRAAGLGSRRPALLRQVHGDAVVRRGGTGGIAPEEEPGADAQISEDPGLALVIRSADCVPVLLADPDSGAAGAAHAGWKGTSLGVAARLVEELSRAFGAPPGRLHALIGPAIGACCYRVREDVASVFRSRFPAEGGFLRGEPAGGLRLDLPAANASLLAGAGLDPERIATGAPCTACRADLFPSYRRDGPGAGRLWSFISPGRGPLPR